MDPHTWLSWKALHIIGAVVFIGNVTTAALWKGLANRTRHPRTIAYAQYLVTWTDAIFTFPGATLLSITAILMAREMGHFWDVTWMRQALILLVVSTAAWAFVLVPVEVVQHRLARRFEGETDPDRIPAVYWRNEWIWFGVGIPATVLPYVNIWLMVTKPS